MTSRRIVRDNWAQNITRFFITDDNFARNKEWEAIFDRLAKLREVDKIPLGIMIQVDTMCHKIDGFIEKAKKAGVTRVFLGLENINPDNLAAAKKKQNKITEYRKMLLAWKAQGIFIYAGYILGFPGDTPESIRRDIEIIQRELPLDLLEFNILTPLPGSEDHKILWNKKVDMDADLNKYDLEHVVTDHPKMTREVLQSVYQESWGRYYTPRAHRDVAQARGRHRCSDHEPRQGAHPVFHDDAAREGASAPERAVTDEASERAAPRFAARKQSVVSSAPYPRPVRRAMRSSSGRRCGF